MTQDIGTMIRPNPIGLAEDEARESVLSMNKDLASMEVLYNQYHKHHWIVEGAEFFELHLLLEAHYTELHEHYDLVAERIVTLGGLPVASPAAMQQHAYIQSEPEGLHDLRDMINNDLAAERKLAENLRKHVAEAEERGDYGSEGLLKQVLLATEQRAFFLEKHLQRESLSRKIPAE